MDKQIIIVVDDFDQETPAETVTFEFENEPYEIDLAEHNQVELKQAMDTYEAAVEGLLPFLKAARFVGHLGDEDLGDEDSGDLVNEFVPEAEPEVAKPRRRRKKASGASDSDVRRWAQENDVPVNAKGRVPASVREQYVDAQ